MKKTDYRDFIIFMILTIIVSSMVITTDLIGKELDELYLNIDSQLKHITVLENDIKNIKGEKDTMTTSILELERDIEELERDIEKLETDNKSLEKKINQQITTKTNTKVSTSNMMIFEATAYSGDPITATGTVPKVGRTIAVDPKVIPYGSQVYIEGMGTFIAEDCGGAIKGNIIDIFMGSKEECRAWGRRKVQIKVL